MVERVKASLSKLAQDSPSASLERSGLRTWDFEDLPQTLTAEVATAGVTQPIRAFPALVDEGSSVAIRLLASADEQHEAMWSGTRRLLRFAISSPVKVLDGLVDHNTKLHLATGPIQSKAEWYNDAIDCALDETIAQQGGPAWTATGFERLTLAAQKHSQPALAKMAADMAGIITSYRQAQDLLAALEKQTTIKQSVLDIQAHLGRLAYPGLMTGVGFDRTGDVARYIKAISFRLETLRENPQRDLLAAAECVKVEATYRALVAEHGLLPEIEEATWMIEELRVAQFAQHLRKKESDGKVKKVSANRVARHLASIS